jgi:multidrug efflux pump subunit AcrA (membrane-fusion protein)
MRGRWPAGVEYIDKLSGSEDTKQRFKAILDTLHGEARLLEVCAQLGIGETRFHQLRETALQAALTAIAPRPAGRPSRAAGPEAAQIQALQQQVRDLQHDLHETQVRAEIALVLGGATDHDQRDAAAEKKMPQRHVKINKPR